MKNSIRKYYHSSSFTMALIFSVLLGVAACILGYFIYNADDASGSTIKTLSMFIIGLMLAVIFTSFFISIFVVRRINSIASTARDIIDTGDLSRRISMDNRWDDLSYLADILNELLSRTEFLMEGVKNVSNNIAHDLRTPLSRLRNDLENLKQHPGIEAEADDLIQEADKLLGTFNALLRISNIETGKRRQKFTHCKLDELITDVIELYAPLAEDKNITLTHHLERVNLQCDKDLLFQAIANVLDNAIKFTPATGTVALTLEKGPLITIADSGEGIADDEKPKVCNRFYRTEASRNTAGNGLGLSLVAAVVELHKGKVILENNAPGLIVKLEF